MADRDAKRGASDEKWYQLDQAAAAGSEIGAEPEDVSLQTLFQCSGEVCILIGGRSRRRSGQVMVKESCEKK